MLQLQPMCSLTATHIDPASLKVAEGPWLSVLVHLHSLLFHWKITGSLNPPRPPVFIDVWITLPLFHELHHYFTPSIDTQTVTPGLSIIDMALEAGQL